MDSVTLRIGFSANHDHWCDRLIERMERRYSPADLALFAPDETVPSHVWIEAHVPGSLIIHDDVYEAVPPCVRHGTFADKLGQDIRLYDVPCPAFVAAACLQTAKAHLGEPYNFVGVVATGLLIDLRLKDIWERIEAAHVDCVEYVLNCLAAGGIDLLPGVRATNATPLMVESAIRRLGWRRVDTSLHAAIA